MIQKGDTLHGLGILLPPDRDGKTVLVKDRIVHEVLANRTGLIRVRAYPVGSKVNHVVKNETVSILDPRKIIRQYEDIPTNLEVWEIPASFVA